MSAGCLTCSGSGWESKPITNSASPEPGIACVDCGGTGVSVEDPPPQVDEDDPVARWMAWKVDP